MAGAGTAAFVGFVAGSEVPILGNIIGALVGLGVYFVVDDLAGDDIDGGVRDALGENGCDD